MERQVRRVLRKGTFELLLVRSVCKAGWRETQNVGQYFPVSGCNGNQLWTVCVCVCVSKHTKYSMQRFKGSKRQIQTPSQLAHWVKHHKR